MAPTSCGADPNSYVTYVNFVLRDNDYTGWQFQLWRLDVAATAWALEDIVFPVEETMPVFGQELFCIESPAPNARYMVQAINIFNGM